MKAPDDQIRAWRDTGHPYKLIAAAVAEWAAGKERGSGVPDDDFFGIAAGPNTYQRARTFLVTQGVLQASDGLHYVALPSTACPAVRRARERPLRAGTCPGERSRLGAAAQAAASQGRRGQASIAIHAR